MKSNIILFIAIIACFNIACVQKTYDRTVVLQLTVKEKKDITTVGVRGEGKPLSWQEDFPMKELIKDSLYTATLHIKTGYLFGECKFTVNGEFELNNKPDRKISFNPNGTTYYNAVFNEQ